MDRSFVPGDQSLALEGSQSEFWCIKPPTIFRAGWLLLLWPPLRTGEFRPPEVQTPNKALYCLFLWLIGFYSPWSLRKPFTPTIHLHFVDMYSSMCQTLFLRASGAGSNSNLERKKDFLSWLIFFCK